MGLLSPYAVFVGMYYVGLLSTYAVSVGMYDHMGFCFQNLTMSLQMSYRSGDKFSFYRKSTQFNHFRKYV